jgi:hypothetical protein
VNLPISALFPSPAPQQTAMDSQKVKIDHFRFSSSPPPQNRLFQFGATIVEGWPFSFRFCHFPNPDLKQQPLSPLSVQPLIASKFFLATFIRSALRLPTANCLPRNPVIVTPSVEPDYSISLATFP